MEHLDLEVLQQGFGNRCLKPDEIVRGVIAGSLATAWSIVSRKTTVVEA